VSVRLLLEYRNPGESCGVAEFLNVEISHVVSTARGDADAHRGKCVPPTHFASTVAANSKRGKFPRFGAEVSLKGLLQARHCAGPRPGAEHAS